MAEQATDTSTQIARDYYNSDDADLFYREIWGGEDIHVGIYEDHNDSIAFASRRTVAQMAQLAGPLGPDSRVVDLGSGYGGAMRFIARTYSSRCSAVNLSAVENERHLQMNREAGLEHLIDVIEGDFSKLAFPDASFDVVWSQEAILHTNARKAVCSEAARVLKAGGKFVFTDPMQADDASPEKLRAVYDRLHLDSLASPQFYRKILNSLNLKGLSFYEAPEQMATHYERVRDLMLENAADLREKGMSEDYIEKMTTGLTHWVEGARNGLLTWGVFLFQKDC